MDPKKTAWERVLDEPVINPPGVTPMKAELDARFDGTFIQLQEWMEQTFKNPGDLRVRVIVGGTPFASHVPETKAPAPVRTIEGARLEHMTKHGGDVDGLSRDEAEVVVRKVFEMKPLHNKLAAIKLVRERSKNLGLKEAKDFVEQIDSDEPHEENIPF